jgi:poly-beta-1,6-N-acetyl-D-glucosamine synthase
LDITDFFIILTWASFLTVILFYLGYVFLLSFFNRKQTFKGKLDFIYPAVSIIVPIHNEEKVILKKLENINELDYPNDKVEVILVDGNSTDKTLEIISDFSRNTPRTMTLIKQLKRNGYTKAVVEGISRSNGSIIIATDAASYHYPDALLHLVKHFSNEKIGAVTGKEVVFGNRSDLGPKLENTYRSFYDFMRKAETAIDSTPDSKGEILAVRREICLALFPQLELSPNASFDSCVPYQAKLMGYRTIFEENAKYYEYAPSTLSDRMTQQTRRATLLIGAFLLYKKLLFYRKGGNFSRLILPMHFVMWCILPMVFLIGSISLFISTFLNPLSIFVLSLWALTVILVIVKQSRYLLISFVQAQFALIFSLFKLAQRQKTLYIKSIPSTRKIVD